jgi:predicted transcriptional regulator
MSHSLLSCSRLPARLAVDQVAEILGFLPHEISVLMRAGLLKPLGRPAANGHKFFCATEIAELSLNRDWLDKATRTVTKRWQERNRKQKTTPVPDTSKQVSLN